MNEDKLNFVRQLYGKYNIELDPEREQKVLSNFERDFDQSLSLFYQKYNQEKINDLTPEFLSKARQYSGFMPIEDDVQDISEPQAPKSVEEMTEAEKYEHRSWLGKKAQHSKVGFHSAYESVTAFPEVVTQNIHEFTDKIASVVSGRSVEELRGDEDSNIRQNYMERAERISEKARRYQEISKSLEGTDTNSIVDAIGSGDILGVLDGAVDGALGYLPSMVVGMTTMGTGFIPMFAGGAMLDDIVEKAELTDQDFKDVIANDENNFVVPLTVGIAAGLLEKYGLAKLGKYATKMASAPGTGAMLKETFANSGRQGVINWLEAGLHEFNKHYAVSDSMEESVPHMAGYLFSKDGLEAGLQAAAGTMLMGGLGRGAAVFNRNQQAEAVNENKTPEQRVEEAGNQAVSEVELQQTVAEEAAPISDNQLDTQINGIIEEYKETSKRDAETEQAVKEAEAQQKAEERAEKTQETETGTTEGVTETTGVSETAEAVTQTTQEDQAPVWRKVRDLQSLKNALYEFTGISVTDRDQVRDVSKMAEFINSVAGVRARKDGISTEDWYKSRIAGIGVGAETVFQSDGSALIGALDRSDMRGFVREFGKVVQKDLNSAELSAINEEFGMDLNAEANSWTNEALDRFVNTFESYIESGKMPEGMKPNLMDKIQSAFTKLGDWIRDIKSNIEGEVSELVSPELREAFDSIVMGVERQEDAKQPTKTQEKAPRPEPKKDTPKSRATERTDKGDAKAKRDEDRARKEAEKERRKVEKEQETIDKVVEDVSSLSVELKDDNTYSTKDRNAIQRGITQAENMLKKETITPTQKKALNEEVKRLKQLQENEREAREFAQNRKKSVASAKRKASAAGLSREQIDDFVKKFPNSEILDVEDGHIIHHLDMGSGEVMAYESSKGRNKKKATFDKEQTKKAAKREVEAKRERAKSKEEAERAKRIDKAADDADRFVEYSRVAESKLTNKYVERTLDRINDTNVEDMKLADESGEGDLKGYRDAVKSFIERVIAKYNNATHKGTRAAWDGMKGKVNDHIHNFPFFTEKERDALAEKLRITNANNDELAQFKEAEKLAQEESKKDVKGTILDGETQIQSVHTPGPIQEMIKRFLNGFSMNTRILSVDLSVFDRNSPLNANATDNTFNKRVREAREALVRVVEASEVEITMEEFNKQLNDLIEGADGAFMELGDNLSILVYQGNRSQDSVAHTILHELGHAHFAEVFKNASKAVKDAITDDFNKFIMKKLGSKTPKMTYEEILQYMATRTAFQPSRQTTMENEAYYTSFEEWYAESVAEWAAKAEKPRTALGKFFTALADMYDKIIQLAKHHMNVSTNLERFLDEGFKIGKQKITDSQRREMKMHSNRAEKAASSMMDLESRRDVLKDDIRSGVYKKEELKKVQARVAKFEKDISSKREEIRKIHDDYLAVGGKNPFEKFMNKAIADAKAKERAAIGDDILGDLSTDVRFDIDFKINNTASARELLVQKTADAVDGKFKNEKEFRDIIKKINEALENAALKTLTREEAKEIFERTRSGAIVSVKAPLISELRKRPTKRLESILESMNADATERLDALNQMAEILAQGELSKEDMVKASELFLVGLANENAEEIRTYLKTGAVKAIVSENYEGVLRAAQAFTNEKNVDAAEAFYSSFYGAEKLSDGSYKDKHGNVFKVFDQRREYGVGDIVERRGSMYEQVKEREAGKLFSDEDFKFLGNITIKKSKAERDMMDHIQSIKNWLSNVFLASHSLESIANKLSTLQGWGAFESPASKLIGEDGFRKAQIRSDRDFVEVDKGLMSAAKRIFNVESDSEARKKLLEMRTKQREISFEDNNGHGIKNNMYISELMTYYSYMLQPDLAQRFENMKARNFDSQDIRFWNENKRAAIMDALTAEEKAMVEAVVDNVMPKLYDKVNETHKTMNGHDLLKLKRYFPIAVSVSMDESVSEVDTDIKDFKSLINSVGNNNLKDRTSATAPLMPTDFIQTTLKYASRASHYANYAIPMSKVSAMLEQGHYKEFLKNVYGNEILDNISHNLNNIAAGGAANYQRNKYIDMMRNLAIGGAFMGNLTMIPKQLTSFAAYASWMPTGTWASYYAKIMANPNKVVQEYRELMDMPFIVRRLQEGSGANIDTMNLMLSNFEREVNKSKGRKSVEQLQGMLNQVLFAPVKLGDIGAIIAGGLPYYRHLKEEAVKKHGSMNVEAKEWVEVKFAEATSRTQQSRNMLDASKWQTSGSLSSLFVTFMSTPMLYGRILAGGVQDMYNGKDAATRLKGAKNVTMFGFVLPLLFQVAAGGGISLMMGDEDNDDLKENPIFRTMAMFGASMAQHVPILYPILQNFVDRAILGRNFDLNVAPPLGIAEGAISATIRITERYAEKGEIDFEDEQFHKEMAKIARALGVNYGAGKNLVDAWSDVEETWEKDARLLFGWSPGALGIKSDANSRASTGRGAARTKRRTGSGGDSRTGSGRRRE